VLFYDTVFVYTSGMHAICSYSCERVVVVHSFICAGQIYRLLFSFKQSAVWTITA